MFLRLGAEGIAEGDDLIHGPVVHGQPQIALFLLIGENIGKIDIHLIQQSQIIFHILFVGKDIFREKDRQIYMESAGGGEQFLVAGVLQKIQLESQVFLQRVVDQPLPVRQPAGGEGFQLRQQGLHIPPAFLDSSGGKIREGGVLSGDAGSGGIAQGKVEGQRVLTGQVREGGVEKLVKEDGFLLPGGGKSQNFAQGTFLAAASDEDQEHEREG